MNNQRHKSPWRRPIGAAAIALAGIGAGVLVCLLGGYRINVSTSVPIGVWQLVDASAAAHVRFCLTTPLLEADRLREYTGSGSCPDGSKPLLKRVAAHAGDIVDLAANGLAVNGRPVAHSAPRAKDGRGRPLPRLPDGRYVVGPDELWVVGDDNPYSYDSRYFGPISRASVTAALRPVAILSRP